MRRRRREPAFALAAALISILAPASAAAAAVERPPQFVAIAFDNCTEVSRWRELRDFAARLSHLGQVVLLEADVRQ